MSKKQKAEENIHRLQEQLTKAKAELEKLKARASLQLLDGGNVRRVEEEIGKISVRIGSLDAALEVGQKRLSEAIQEEAEQKKKVAIDRLEVLRSELNKIFGSMNDNVKELFQAGFRFDELIEEATLLHSSMRLPSGSLGDAYSKFVGNKVPSGLVIRQLVQQQFTKSIEAGLSEIWKSLRLPAKQSRMAVGHEKIDFSQLGLK